MGGFSTNKQGRSYIRGKGVDDSLRCVIIDPIIAEGGDPASGYFGGQFKEVAVRYRVTDQFVSKLWKTFCETELGIICPQKIACEQALCLGKNSEEREGKGGREPVDKHLRPLFRLL